MQESLKLKDIACQAGKQNQCRIYDIYRHKDRLQVFIDKKEGQAVRLEDCEKVFHSLRLLLLSELPQLLRSRRLEVSSPGVERRLREKWHFEEALGQTVQVVAFAPVALPGSGQSRPTPSFQAQLTAISGENVSFKKGALQWELSLANIKSARRIFHHKGAENSLSKKTHKKHHKKTRRSHVC